jgi:hypothetical protein
MAFTGYSMQLLVKYISSKSAYTCFNHNIKYTFTIPPYFCQAYCLFYSFLVLR